MKDKEEFQCRLCPDFTSLWLGICPAKPNTKCLSADMPLLIINILWTNEGAADKIRKGSFDKHTCQIWNYSKIYLDYKTTNMGTVLLDEDFCKARRLEEKLICRKVVGLQNSKYYLYIYKYDLVLGRFPGCSYITLNMT